MNKICYLLVTCSREKTRSSMLETVVSTLKSHDEWSSWKNDTFVFDNDSSVEGTKEFLQKNFKNLLFSQENYGYWSAVNWFSNFALEKQYEYIYIMESDCVHFDISQMKNAVKVLDLYQDIGMVRTAEFSVANRHLYDKSQFHKDSKKSEWFQQKNHFTSMPASYEKTEIDKVYKTNLVAKVCGLHRINSLKKVMQNLATIEWFSELDFQKFYHEDFSFNAILDGGMYNSKIAYEPNSIAGSLVVEKIDQNGYRKTREGFVTPVNDMKIDLSFKKEEK